MRRGGEIQNKRAKVPHLLGPTCAGHPEGLPQSFPHAATVATLPWACPTSSPSASLKCPGVTQEKSRALSSQPCTPMGLSLPGLWFAVAKPLLPLLPAQQPQTPSTCPLEEPRRAGSISQRTASLITNNLESSPFISNHYYCLQI